MHAGKDRRIEFCKAVDRFRAYLCSFDDKAEDAEDLAPAVTESVNFLGSKDPAVPQEVHERMCALALQGVIPKTCLPMRQRAKKCIGSKYDVPQFLSEARAYNYIILHRISKHPQGSDGHPRATAPGCSRPEADEQSLSNTCIWKVHLERLIYIHDFSHGCRFTFLGGNLP